MPSPSFETSSQRHFDDADFLSRNGSLANADHLCGFSAECALKAIVVAGLGGTLVGGFVQKADGIKLRAHLGGANSAWSEIALLADGRTEPEVLDLLREDPFTDWDVSDRYSDGTHITPTAYSRHLDGARRARIALEAIKLSNMDGTY